MKIRRANRNDLPKIGEVSEKYGWPKVPPEFINKRDIALVAIDDEKVIHGFIWVGLMAQNKYGFIEWFLVNPEMAGKGVGAALGSRMVEVASKIGVEYLMGTIHHDNNFEKSMVNAVKIGMNYREIPNTIVLGQVKHMKEHLGV